MSYHLTKIGILIMVVWAVVVAYNVQQHNEILMLLDIFLMGVACGVTMVNFWRGA